MVQTAISNHPITDEMKNFLDRELQSKKIAVVKSRFNEQICEGLLNGVIRAFDELGLNKEQLKVLEVPGAFEIPVVAQKAAQSDEYLGVIALGCVIRGDTPHFEYVCEAATEGCLKAGLNSGKPVAFGVITVDNTKQAVERSSNDDYNKGRESTFALFETLYVMEQV